MKKLFIIGALIVSVMASAQDVEVLKVILIFLKTEKSLNIEFDYSKLTLMEEKKSEADYVATRTKELNDKNKTVGDIWKKKWETAKEGIWQPKFLELVNVVLAKKKKDLIFQEGLTTAKYTLIVDVVWIYPGWDVFMMKQPAKVTTNLKFVETANKSKVLLELSSDKAPGDQFGNNFSNESRIGEGFAKTAKTLAGYIVKNTK